MKKLLFLILVLAPMSMFAQKFGRVNSVELMQVLPEYATATSSLQALAKQYDDDLKRMQTELQKKSDDYDKEKATLPDAIKQRREQELQDMYQRMMQSQQTSQQDLQKQQQEKFTPIQEKVIKAIQAVGQAGGYTCIFDQNQGIPYMSDTLCKDLTGEVKVKMGLSANAKPAVAPTSTTTTAPAKAATPAKKK